MLADTDGRIAFAAQHGVRAFQPREEVARVEGARTLAWIDADNDGDLDLAVGTPERYAVVMRRPRGFFTRVVVPLPSDVRLIADDLDLDGRVDLIGLDSHGKLRVAWNQCTSGNHSLRVQLCGRRGDASGVDAEIDGFAGSQGWLHAVARRGVATLGIGSASTVDALYVRWADGTDQPVEPSTSGGQRRALCSHDSGRTHTTSSPTPHGYCVHQSIPYVQSGH